MEKTNEIRCYRTPCDRCPNPATILDGSQAFCASCCSKYYAGEKKASDSEQPIKQLAVDLIDKH